MPLKNTCCKIMTKAEVLELIKLVLTIENEN
jgi:hypothetical protein